MGSPSPGRSAQGSPACLIMVVSASRNVTAFREMMDVPMDGVLRKPVRIDRLLDHILALLPVPNNGAYPRLGPCISRTIEHIAQHYEDRLDLVGIASTVNISRAHLAHLFKLQTGTTLKRFLRDLRLELARRILVSTDTKLDEVAQRVGVRRRTSSFPGVLPGDRSLAGKLPPQRAAFVLTCVTDPRPEGRGF